jgi:hypothetical protein
MSESLRATDSSEMGTDPAAHRSRLKRQSASVGTPRLKVARTPRLRLRQVVDSREHAVGCDIFPAWIWASRLICSHGEQEYGVVSPADKWVANPAFGGTLDHKLNRDIKACAAMVRTGSRARTAIVLAAVGRSRTRVRPLASRRTLDR